MVGQGSVNHNSRKFNAKNTDPERSHLNITYCHENKHRVHQSSIGINVRYSQCLGRNTKSVG